MHRTAIRRLLPLLAAALVLAACSTGGASATPSTTAPSVAPTDAPSKVPSAAPPSPSAAEPEGTANATAATIAVAQTSLGEIVVDAEGRTLYLFTRDTPGAATSVCNDDCAADWPPLLVEEGETAAAGQGVTGELGTATRDDGTTQVTLNGWPLYYFAGDTAAGDTNGQGVNDVWFVVTPAGEAVEGGSGTDEY